MAGSEGAELGCRHRVARYVVPPFTRRLPPPARGAGKPGVIGDGRLDSALFERCSTSYAPGPGTAATLALIGSWCCGVLVQKPAPPRLERITEVATLAAMLLWSSFAYAPGPTAGSVVIDSPLKRSALLRMLEIEPALFGSTDPMFGS